MRLFDTHCHIHHSEDFPDVAGVLNRARGAGVDRVVAIGLDIELSRGAIELAQEQEGVYATVGRHPAYSPDFQDSDLAQLAEWLELPEVVALGEIGLDFYRDHSSKEEQLRCLHPQLELAESSGAPVVFHCRDAYDDLLDEVEGRNLGSFVMHCFSGEPRHAERAADMGAYFGMDGPITFKNNDALRELVRTLPRDRILIETDSPYLAPEPMRGKANEPALLKYVNGGLAKALDITPEACAALTTANAERFYRLSPV